MNNVDNSLSVANPTPDMPALREALGWIDHFADMRSKDDSKTFARVNRGALRTISVKAREALSTSLAPRSGSVGEDLEWAARKAENMGRCANGSGGADCCERLGEDIAEDIREYAASQPPAAPETSEGDVREAIAGAYMAGALAVKGNDDPDFDFIVAGRDYAAALSLSLPAVDAGRREAAEIAQAEQVRCTKLAKDRRKGAKQDHALIAAIEAERIATSIRARIGKPLAGEV